ncbi:hypothetical protein C8J56DRAFT_919736 [Mycena floridula]|nr:hypothetical protein C8J56DRAFT_919736 [Mycena floridula]
MSDFQFSFDPSLFPTPPPLPSSADLFSPNETNDLLGFLDNFGSFQWEGENNSSSSEAFYNPSQHSYPNYPPQSRPRRSTRSAAPSRAAIHSPPPKRAQVPRAVSQTSNTSDSSSSTAKNPDSAAAAAARARPLLSTPQKRLNHIMSEQKRRNAIRDGYAQLISLLAPAGSGPAMGMPTRGRPKGSGSRGGKAQTKGKSGVLFRAVEYCKWLEEGRYALEQEVLRLEAVVGR